VDVTFGSLGTPVGQLSVAVSAEGLCAVGWGSAASLGARLGLAGSPGPASSTAVAELAAYFSGSLRAFSVPLDWSLTGPSQRRVLGALYETVPFGESVTYGGLAGRSGSGVPARGIGAIMGSNPLPIVVPCHRVLAATGLGGYSGRGGLATKQWLLMHEGVLPPTLDFGTAGSPGEAR
jgi:methylated-DNA-[protein]-cysteine S-methyltransferase